MEHLTVKGGRTLSGRIDIPAAKNAVLPMIAAALLSEEDVTIRNCPRLTDIEAMARIVRLTGGKAVYDGGDLTINCADCDPKTISSELTGGIRSSIFILGPILSRFGHAAVSYPGGCEIGLRPIDLHIYGLRRLNVNIREEDGLIVCDGSNMRAGEIDLDFPSVGATENLMMAAVFLPGRTVVRNAAREPEVADLAGFINALGGRIYGAGTDTVTVEGVKRLSGGEYAPVPDRIAGGTFMAACVIAGGDIMLDGLRADTVYAVTEKLERAGATVTAQEGGVRVRSTARPAAIHKIETRPYPGFPTDMQAQMTALLAGADGCSVMVENLFENRYKHTAQLGKMGARITVKDRVAVIKGEKRLHGAKVVAEDLRGGAALVLAGLGAEGETVISGVRHIDRGYRAIEEDLARLGADIERVSDERAGGKKE